MQGRKRGTKSPANLSAPTCPSINHPLIHHPLTRHSSIDQSLPIYLLFIQPLTLPTHVSSPSVYPSLHSPSSVHPLTIHPFIVHLPTAYPPIIHLFVYYRSILYPWTHYPSIHSLTYTPSNHPSSIQPYSQSVSQAALIQLDSYLLFIHIHTYIHLTFTKPCHGQALC